MEQIRQQYHSDMKAIRKKMGCALEEDSKISHKTYLVKKSDRPIHQEAPEEETRVQAIERDLKQSRLQSRKESKIPEPKHKAKRGVKFEINLDKCISDENILQEEETAMVERPKLAAVRGHYAYFYAQLDGLRDRAHGPNCHHDPQKDTEVEETYNLAEIHSPPPGQRTAEYLQRKREAQQYKLKVEKQLGLRPSSAEPNHEQRQEPRSDGEEPGFQGPQFRRNETKEQEYWKQLEQIRQQYHSDMKAIRKKMGCALEVNKFILRKGILFY